jgi:hypothetical protein
MFPRRLSGVAWRGEQLARTEEGGRRAAGHVVAEECQRVNSDGASDRNKGGTNTDCLLLAMRHAVRVVVLACTHGPPNSKP